MARPSKILAVFGRAEARDFVDLMAVEPTFGLDRLCELAAEKDRGFTPAIFAETLGGFRRLRRDEFELDEHSTPSWAPRSTAGANAPSSLDAALSSGTNAARISATNSES